MIKDHLALWRARWERLVEPSRWKDTPRYEVENLANEQMGAYQDACERLDEANKDIDHLTERLKRTEKALDDARKTIASLAYTDVQA